MPKMYDHVMSKTANYVTNAFNALGDKNTSAALGSMGKLFAAGGLMAYGVNQLMTKLQNDTRRKALIDDLITNDPILKSAGKQQVMEFYLTIMQVAPSISLDRNIVKELLQNFVKFGRIDINTIKTLAEIEKTHSQTTSSSLLSKLI